MNIKLSKHLASILTAAAIGATSGAFAGYTPAFNIVSGTLISTASADQWYCPSAPCDATSTRELWAYPNPDRPLEITALANALHNDVDLIYEFVRNNIEVVPMYGLQKGALGALIDRSGTAFDQAQLMVELLRSAEYTRNHDADATNDVTYAPAYLAGKITLTGNQVNDWIGTKKLSAVTKIFADGGIPADLTGTTNVTSAVIAHIWVRVSIQGTNNLFDPAYKAHTVTASPINLQTAMQWNETSFLAAAQGGMASGLQSANNGTAQIPYVSGINAAAAATQLTTYANNLVSYLKANPVGAQPYATLKLEDLLGKQEITPSTGVVRQTALPYTAVVQHTWTGDIPNVYRTKLTLEVLDWVSKVSVLSRVLFADEIYGRRVIFDTLTTGQSWDGCDVRLQVDGVYVTDDYVCTQAPGIGSKWVRLSIDHPYAASNGTYMDVSGTNAIVKAADFTSPVAVITGFGDVSERLQSKLAGEQEFDRLLPEGASYRCGAGGCEPKDVLASANGISTSIRAAAGWLAQYSRMAMIQSRMKSSIHQQHHSLGVAYRRSILKQTSHDPHQGCWDCWSIEGAQVIDVDTAVSVTSKSDVAADRTVVVRSLSAAADMLEASQFEQIADTATPSSVAHRFNWGNTYSGTPGTMRFYMLVPGATTTELFPGTSTPYNFPSISNIFGAYVTAGYKVIAAADSMLGPGTLCESDCSGAGGEQSVNSVERGGAFQAIAPDGLSVAGIVTDKWQRSFKGGTAGDPPKYDDIFSADHAADLVKDQFKNHSADLGIDLASGDFPYTPPEDLSVGSGEFPYKLSFQRSFRPGLNHAPGMGRGWTHNLDYRIALSSSGMEAMGQSSVLTAASSLVALYATEQLYSQMPSPDLELLKRWVLVPFVQSWWADQIRFNTVTYTAGAGSKTFVRLPDGTFNPPSGYKPASGAGYWNLQQTGSPVNDGSRWSMSGVNFTLTSPTKDVQTFEFWGKRNKAPDQPYLQGGHHGWHLKTWTWPKGVSLTFSYVPTETPNLSDDLLVSVQNSLGRQININSQTGVGDWNACNLQSVSDGSRTAIYDCATNTMTSPMQEQSWVVYGDANCDISTWPNHTTARPRCGPYIKDVYLPSDAASPKMHLEYDAVGHVSSYSDAEAIKNPGNRSAYAFYITGVNRGERLDPAGYRYTVYYDTFGHATQFIDELGHTTQATYDGLNRVATRRSPGGVLTTFTYDSVGNTTQVVQTPSQATLPPVSASISVGATYDPTCGKIATVTDANHNVTTWTYNTTTCLVDHVDQPSVPNAAVAGSPVQVPTTHYTYTSIGLLDTITDPSGMVVDLGYDALGNRTSQVVDPGASPHVALTKTYEYDTVGNTTSVTIGPVSTHKTTYL
jgi:YD repeat-containing protein